MATVSQQNTSTNIKLDEIAEQMKQLSAWMKFVDHTTSNLVKNTTLLQLHAEDTASRLSQLEDGRVALRDNRHTSPHAEGTASLTPMSTVVQADIDNQPRGRRVDNLARGQDPGVHRPADPPPGSGMFRSAHQSFDRESDPHHHTNHHRPFVSTPKMDFPKFDGEDYQIWLDNCELYFKIYGVSPNMKVKFATLNMIVNAALWLKTVQKRGQFVHWSDTCTAVVERWGKSKHTFYMRQMLVLSQTSSIEEYTAKFNTMKHQILLEDPNTSEVFFVERYLAGLRTKIRAMVVLHCPGDTDAASLLATL